MSVLNKQWKGFRHIPIISNSAKRVKPATAYLNKNSILMMNTCSSKHIINIEKRIVTIYKKWCSLKINLTYSIKFDISYLVFDIYIKYLDVIDSILPHDLEYKATPGNDNNHNKDKAKGIKRCHELLHRSLVWFILHKKTIGQRQQHYHKCETQKAHACEERNPANILFS